jgi:DNA-binding NtrC family response regulator
MARIFVIDDDADLRTMIADALVFEHEISTARDGLEAVQRIRAGDRFDVILSDLTMPRLDGTQLYWQLVEIAPDQAHRMVFMSGGDYVLAARQLLTGVKAPYLAKPFVPDRVRVLVADLIELWGPYSLA